jgi:DNA-binding MarR family transcriptional regulator
MPDPALDIDPRLFKDRLPGTDPDVALLVFAATRLGRILELEMQQNARRSGLEMSEYYVINLVSLAGPEHLLSPTQLSEIVLQTTGGMTKTLHRLEVAGLVERLPDPNDGRRRLVRLTPAGSRLVERDMRPMFDRWESTLEGYGLGAIGRLANDLWSFTRFLEESFRGRIAVGPRLSDSKAVD